MWGNGSPVLGEVFGATKYSQFCSTWIFSPSEYSILIRSSTRDVGKCLDLAPGGLTNGRTNYQPLCLALGLSDLPGNRSQPLQPSETMTVPLNQPLLIREPMGSSCTSPHSRLIYLLALPRVWLRNYCWMAQVGEQTLRISRFCITLVLRPTVNSDWWSRAEAPVS